MIAETNTEVPVVNFDPYNEQHIQRLRAAVHWSRDRLQRFRVKYRELVEQFVTENYSEEADYSKKVVINLLAMAVEIHVLHLAPSQPQVSIWPLVNNNSIDNF